MNYNLLLDEYEKTKEDLQTAERTLYRITGRDPSDFSNNGPGFKYRKISSTFPSQPPYLERKRQVSFPIKREAKDLSNDEANTEEEDDELPKEKPTLQSAVVASRSQGRSRRTLIEEQNVNSKIKSRNRRMFGALIGTLEKFQNEEKKRKSTPNESMRAEIEQRVEAAAEEEKERIKNEKKILFATCREKQVQMRCLEKKLERLESYEVFDSNFKHLLNFIKTHANPPIFFAPARHNEATKKSLKKSRDKILEIIKEKKQCVEKELNEIDESYRRDSKPDDNEIDYTEEQMDTGDIPESEPKPLATDQKVRIKMEGLENFKVHIKMEGSENVKNVESVVDTEFEPIYD